MKATILSVLFIIQFCLLKAQNNDSLDWNIGINYNPSFSFRFNTKFTNSSGVQAEKEYHEYNNNYQVSVTRRIMGDFLLINFNIGLVNMGFKSNIEGYFDLTGKNTIPVVAKYDVNKSYIASDIIFNLLVFKKIVYAGIGFSFLVGINDELIVEFKNPSFYYKLYENNKFSGHNYSGIFNLGIKKSILKNYYYNLGLNFRCNLFKESTIFNYTQHLYNAGLLVGVGLNIK